MSGTITLYNWDGESVTSKFYSSLCFRKEILYEWERRYGKHYRHCYYQISPDTEDIAEVIDRRGNNKLSA